MTNEIERREVQEFIDAVKEFDTTGKREATSMEVGEVLLIENTVDEVIYRKEKVNEASQI